MNRVAALVAIILILFAAPFGGAALAAPSAPAQDVPVATGGPLRLELTQMVPRIVTATGPGTLTVTGTLTNTGDVPVDELVIRVQRGNPLDTQGDVRDALDGNARTDAVTPQFIPLPGVLAPGAELPIQLAVPLRGAPETTLALSATGVHELLVNVNGVPGDGDRARLAAARMLLPVLSLPADPATPDAIRDAPANAGPATPFALLYPIADTPRRLPTVPGERTLLTDDDLAASFAPDGRLGGLVAALAQTAPVGSRVRDATCLAIDPDLVETAEAMTAGYDVLLPDGTRVPGTGAEAAGRWLADLVAVARGSCVIALPYADADLVALTRGELGELATRAVTDGREVLTRLLQTPVVDGGIWPADGVVDEATLEQIAQADGRSLLLSADSVEQAGSTRSRGVLPIAGSRQPQFAVLTDPLLARAAGGPAVGTTPVIERGAAAPATTLAGTVGPLAAQDVIGALAFRTGEASPGSAEGPRVLAPPHHWAAGTAAARSLLVAVDELIDSGRLTPARLGAVLTTGPPADEGAQPVAYPIPASGREVPASVVEIVRATADDVADLRSAAVEDSAVGVSPDEVFAPLQRGLVWPTSAAWRGRPEAAIGAATAADLRIDELRNMVRVLEPPGPYSLGTSDAPLLITVANGLPFTVQVQVEIAPSPGLRVAPIPVQEVPPLGRRQVQVSAEVLRSGRFTVQAAVRAPAGELLGPPSRLQVRSTAYGTITVWLTGSAGVLLVVLAVRRVLRRIRGEPGRHAENRPDQRRELSQGPPGGSGGPGGAGDRGGGPRPGPGGLPPGGRPVPGRGHGPPPHGHPAPPSQAARPAAAARPQPLTNPVPDEAVTEQLPAVGGAKEQPSIGRSTSLMAVASLVSRITGFLRQIALFAVLGATILNDSYTIANTLPNIVYELLLGGVLSSVLIPLLVRAQSEDGDGGEAYTRRLLTLTGVALLLATAVAMAAAPLLVRVYIGGETTSTADPQLATTLAYMLLPQILFYGFGALLGAILNSRGAFGAFAWAPVLNNVVVIGVVGVYLVVPQDVRLLVLGVGTTLGIVVQAVVLVPALRRIGFRYRPVWGWDPRLTKAGGLALWTVVYVLVGQAGLIVTSQVATAADGGAYAIYSNAWLLLQVPYGVLGVSILTALMPRMSRAAAEGRTQDVVADLALGSRLAAVFLVPISVLLTIFGTPVGIALFGLREATLDGAEQLGTALAVSAFGLLPYAITMLQLRVFYALTDSRTPTLIQLVTVATKIPLLLLCPVLLPPEDVVLGLVAANSVSFVAGAVLGQVLLRRRLGALPTAAVLGTTGRTLAGSVAAGLLALGAVTLLDALLLAGLSPLARAWTVLAVATAVFVPATVLAMRLLRVRELDSVISRLERLVDRAKPRRGGSR
ncbi:murein biosynthesis integral membrane protein MurJ [Pseudonocardia nigra]|uniref:murein biosynthesis integral membrane protein MurJ n=1 Tax=Pseudonocardia nigra TaxID=1921578 RepID=UPI001C5F8D20|nr:murein biosynthesis integral membrane protein MurJ [Pseudonocardia nigra]